MWDTRRDDAPRCAQDEKAVGKLASNKAGHLGKLELADSQGWRSFYQSKKVNDWHDIPAAHQIPGPEWAYWGGKERKSLKLMSVRFLAMLLLLPVAIAAQSSDPATKAYKLNDGVVVRSHFPLRVSRTGNLLWKTKELEFGRRLGMLHLHPYRSLQTNYLSASYKDRFTWVFGMAGKQGFFEARYFESGVVFTVQARSDEIAGLVELAKAMNVRSGRDNLTDESLLRLIAADRSDYTLDNQPLVSEDVFGKISKYRWEQRISLCLDGTTLSLRNLYLLAHVDLGEVSICRVPFSTSKIHQVSLLNPRSLLLKRNLLTDIDLKKLKNFRRLQHLDLSFNRIESMDASYPSLVSLRVSGNPLKQIKFVANNRLQSLIADGCELKPQSFNGPLSKLATLDLSHNNLHLGLKGGWEDFASRFPKLRYLDLRGNKLDSLSVAFLGKCGTLEEVDLRDNPLIRNLGFLRNAKRLKKVSLDAQAFRDSSSAAAVLKSLPLLKVVELDFDQRELEPVLPKLENVEYEFRN